MSEAQNHQLVTAINRALQSHVFDDLYELAQ